MLKALIKKQFLELNAFYFQNRKTGSRRSKAGVIGMISVYVLLFLMLGFMFFGVSDLLAEAMIAMKLDWLFFCMMGMISIALGTFGSVFNTYAGLYNAKDNDLLLSMPVPPSKVLFARLTGVYLMSLMYSALVWIPACIRYFTIASPSVLSVIFCVIQIFLISLFVTVLTCVLGWVVALISSKVKNKSFITVILTLAFIGIYYFVYFRINTFLQSLVANAEEIGGKIKSIFYPFYLMGLSASGEVLPMLAVAAIVAALFSLTCFVLSRSFIKITTAKTAEKKAEYSTAQIKTGGFKQALFKKELKRFTSSPTYMLNCGIGTLLTIALAVFAVIKADLLRQYLDLFEMMMPGIKDLYPVIGACIICMLASTNQITAPSVSLEGKNIWILQSMPVDIKDVFEAKQRLHMAVNAPSAFIGAVCIGYVIKADMSDIIYMVLLAFAYILFSAAFGLFLNLKSPNLTWTNETVPVKQSAAVGISLFSGWGISMGIGALGYLLYTKDIALDYYILICSLVLIAVTRYLNNYLNNQGVKIFKSL